MTNLLESETIAVMSDNQQHRRARGVSIQRRIGFAMVALVVLAIALTGVIVLILEDRSNKARIDSYLIRTRDEFAVLAKEGIDPDDGKPFRGPSELLETFLSRTVIGEHEGEIGIVEGEVRWVSSDDVTFRPEEDAELVEHILPLSKENSMQLGTIRTSTRTYRYHITPVQFPTEQGALLHVYNLSAANAVLRELLWIFVWVGVGTSVAVAGVAWLLSRRLLRPIHALQVATESISETDLTSRVPITGNDDLTRLSKAVNRMLDRVEQSVVTQRQLLDDVGHELRTPITIVRGHLELMDIEDPADVAQTTEIAIDELDRMGNLVGDLLILAKAHQSDFVEPTWYSLATLTDQVFEKAKALGNRSWRLRSIASIDAWLDPHRITQAWLQLAANAVKYSDDGSAITLSSSIEQGNVHLVCEDTGVGIPEDELDTIRTRFGRGSHQDHVVGSGLGLSIVETIVDAHHGRLDIESEPGVGSKFAIVLPLTPQGGQR